MVKKKDYENSIENQWCPGCGNFGILDAMKAAFVEQALSPEQILIVSGIGQAAKTPHFLKCNAIHGLHGRALPLALGAKLANHDLKILVNSGDGDCYGEGGNHFIHAARRNVDLTLLVHNNQVYGLTKGQASPTSSLGMVTPIQPGGVISTPVNGPALALVMGAGFVARGFAGSTDHLSRLIQAAMNYKGFSVIDILQPCVSFNRVNTAQWYKDRIKEQDSDNPEDFNTAMEMARQDGDTIPIGIFYNAEKTDYISRMEHLGKTALIKADYDAEKIRPLIQTAGSL